MQLPQPIELDVAKEEDETEKRLKELYYNREDRGSYVELDSLFLSAKKGEEGQGRTG